MGGWTIPALEHSHSSLLHTHDTGRCPKLLVSSPFTIWSNLAALSQLAAIDLGPVNALVERQPRLLVNSPSALRLRFAMLGELLG
jgi:hypothetical protein